MYSVKTSETFSQPDAKHKGVVNAQQIIFMFLLRALDVLFIGGNHVKSLSAEASPGFTFRIQGAV